MPPQKELLVSQQCRKQNYLPKQKEVKNTSQLIANIIGTHQFYCKSTGRELYNKNGVMAWVTGINHKYLNTVIASQIEFDEAITEVTKFFADKKLPFVWTVTPLCLPADLETRLVSKDFSLIAAHHVLSYDLTASLPIYDKRLDIKEAENDTMLDDWGMPLNDGFGSTPENSVGYINMTKCTPYGADQSFHHYVLYHNDKPVSCATLSVSEYGARIDNVATRTDYLRRGFGRAITLFAMEKAKELDHQMICLEASDEGLRLYLGIGFVEAYKNKVYAQRQFKD